MAKGGFYGVQGGRKPGVYNTWDEAKTWGTGAAGARVKKFSSRAEAEVFAAVSSPVESGVASSSASAGRTYLDCQYSEKDEAKALGARWDVQRKAWYVPEGLAVQLFIKWMPDVSNSAGKRTFACAGEARASDEEVAPIKRPRVVSATPGAGSFPPGVEQLWLYTDGSCPGNQNVQTQHNPAGWGVCIVRPGGSEPLAELYGPVVTDQSEPGYLGAEVGSNNTGELSAICEALRWLRDERRHGPVGAAIRYDSTYAANIASGLFKAHKNKRLAAEAQRLFREVSALHTVALEHVRGHTGERWNERADQLANLGAAGRRSVPPHRPSGGA
jgi:ribonuclease HI